MTLVHDDDIGCLEAIHSAHDSLDGNNLDMRKRIDRPARSNHAVMDSKIPHRPACLVDEFLPMDENPDAFAFATGSACDVGENDGLARSGRADDERAAFACSQSGANLRVDVLLIGTKVHVLEWKGFARPALFALITRLDRWPGVG
jgi:hypothetical protein